MSEFNAQKIIDEHGGKAKTRDGREVTQLTDFRVDENYPVFGVMEGGIDKWTREGKFDIHHKGLSDLDLIMPPTVVAEWYDTTHKGRVWSAGLATLESARRTAEFEGVIIHTTLYSDNTVESEVVK